MTREEALKQVEEMLEKMDTSRPGITTEVVERIVSAVVLTIIDQAEDYRYVTDDLTDLEFSIDYDGRVCLDNATLDVQSFMDMATSNTDILDAVLTDMQNDDYGIDLVFTDEELAKKRKEERDAEISKIVREEAANLNFSGLSVFQKEQSLNRMRIVALNEKKDEATTDIERKEIDADLQDVLDRNNILAREIKEEKEFQTSEEFLRDELETVKDNIKGIEANIENVDRTRTEMEKDLLKSNLELDDLVNRLNIIIKE